MPKTPPRLPRALPSWPRWTLLMPKLAVGLLVVSLIALLWLLQRNEVEEQRQTLIGDMLWIEQNLRFHLNGNEERLVQMAADMGSDKDGERIFQVESRHLMGTVPDITQMLWVDGKGQVRSAYPSPTGSRPELDALGPLADSDAFNYAAKLAKPAYTAPYTLAHRPAQMNLLIPIYRHGDFVGMVVAVYSFDALLGNVVPWWFAEKYLLRIRDDGGAVLASKSNIGGEPGLDYTIPFDPPGNGLVLQAQAYRNAGNPAQLVLAAAIVLLAAAVFWSLWALRSHIQRRLAAEQALREEHAFRKAMEDSMTIGMRARDMEGRITYVNPAFCRMSGYTSEEIIGHAPPLPYWDTDHLDQHEEQSDRVLAGEAPHEGFESRIRHKDGHIVNTMVYATPLINGEGRQTGWISSVVDITEKKRAEALQRQQQEKLEQTARLVTMGEMASTLAHELNQPLSAIASYGTGCLNKLESGHYTAAELIIALGKVVQQAQRAGRIIRQVHDFVRKREPQLVDCSLLDVIEDSITLIEPLARKQRVTILHLLPARLPIIHGDPVLLGQVLINLMRNGIDAMTATASDRRQLVVEAECRNQQLEVCVGDRGCGIPPEVAEKIFTPFFTTKTEGMGMGLNICRSVIEFHGGRLWFEAGAEGGTVFIFTLPLEGT